MRKVCVTIKNENGEYLPIGDIETFTILLAECPVVGDCIIIDEVDDRNCDISKNDQICYLYDLCKQELPQGRSSGFEFEVVERTIFRMYKESWICVELQHKPIKRE